MGLRLSGQVLMHRNNIYGSKGLFCSILWKLFLTN